MANVLVTWGCKGLPDETMIVGAEAKSHDLKKGPRFRQDYFLTQYRKQCSRISICAGHAPIQPGKICEPHLDTQCRCWPGGPYFAGTFRQPEMRILSGYRRNMHGCWTCSKMEKEQEKRLRLMEYAKELSGCVTKMLIGFRCGDSSHHLTDADVKWSIKVLHTGFVFVGILEEWPLSVCLFHAMFGGHCHKREFENLHPGSVSNTYSFYRANISDFNNWADPFDGAVYEAARSIFFANLQKHSVSISTCQRKICRSVPEYFQSALV